MTCVDIHYRERFKFRDYARLGAPLTLLVIVAIALIVPAAYSV
jgi:di/tricarboxylate transporter